MESTNMQIASLIEPSEYKIIKRALLSEIEDRHRVRQSSVRQMGKLQECQGQKG